VAILFADSFNSYVSQTSAATGGAMIAAAANGLPLAGYETPTPISSYVYAGVLSNGGKQNSGNALRICYQVGNTTNYLGFTPIDGAISFKRKFSGHWERFVMLSTQLKLTKTYTFTTVLSRIPLIKFGPVTVYVTNDYDSASSTQIYKVYVNGSAQVGRIDAAQWTSLDIEINREEKKLRVWLANQNVWEVDADYFTTQEFEYGGYLKGPSPDYPAATNAVHVGLFELDSVVIMDGSGTENNVRTSSLGVKSLAPDAFASAGFQANNGDASIIAISDTTNSNASYDARYRLGTGAGIRDLLSQSAPGEIQPLAVVLGTISRGVEADSPRVRTAYRQGAGGTVKNGKTQLHAGAWRHNKELINQMPDGTVFSVSKLPNFHFGYQIAAPSEFEPMVNGGFEYLAFAPPGSDLFTIYRGDADATYIQPGEPEYQIPIPVIPNNGPGPQTLKAGTERLGYFGTLTTAELLGYRSLADRVSLTDGTPINNNTLWMKFIDAGKILFIPQKPLRSAISWQAIYQKGLVYGVAGNGPSPLPANSPVSQDVKINAKGHLFRVRLLTGANSDPAFNTYNVQDPITSYNSEWSRLLHRVSDVDPTKTFWERFTGTELGVGGDLSWCQESHPYGVGYRVERGFLTATGLAASIGTAGSGGGYTAVWRPVLEYLGVTDPEPELNNYIDTWAQFTFADGLAFEDVSGSNLLLTSATITDQKLVNTDTTNAPMNNAPPLYLNADEDFSIEGWANFSRVDPLGGSILAMDTMGSTDSDRAFNLVVSGGDLSVLFLLTPNGAGSGFIYGNPAMQIALNTDNHFAVCRVAGVLTIYLNGQVAFSVAHATAPFKTTELLSVRRGAIGKRWNMRIMRGKSAYSASFTPPTSLPAVVIPEYKAEVLPTIVFQACMRKNVAVNEVTGAAITLGTTTVNYGRLLTPAGSSKFTAQCPYFGEGDFTIEVTFRPMAIASGNAGILGQWTSGEAQANNSWILRMTGTSGLLNFWCMSSTGVINKIQTTVGVKGATDSHIVIERVNGVISIYIDSVKVGGGTFALPLNNVTTLLRSDWDSPVGVGNTQHRNIRIAKLALYNGAIRAQATFSKLPNNGVPGPSVLKAGTSQLGYYGTVSSADMLKGADPAALIGLTAGTALNAGTDWLKFAYQGKILFVPKKPLRHNLTWEQIYACGAVYGIDGVGRKPATPNVNQNKIVSIGTQKFKVRLFQGADADPCPTAQYFVNNPVGTQNSEWTQLMQRVWASDPTATYWEKFTEADFGRANGSMSYGVWCQEEHTGWQPNCRVVRNHPAFLGLTTDYINATGAANLSEAWWPVFELVPSEAPKLNVISGTTLPAGTVNTGVTVAENKLTFNGSSFLTIPDDPTAALGTGNFKIDFDFTVFSAPAVAGTALTPLIFWGTWATTGQKVNLDLWYNWTSGNMVIGGISTTANKYTSIPVTLAANTPYSVSIVRESGTVYLYINGRKIGEAAMPADLVYEYSDVMYIGRRFGGTNRSVSWFANMELRSLSIRKS
jgi:hypothetical protein